MNQYGVCCPQLILVARFVSESLQNAISGKAELPAGPLLLAREQHIAPRRPIAVITTSSVIPEATQGDALRLIAESYMLFHAGLPHVGGSSSVEESQLPLFAVVGFLFQALNVSLN